MLDNFFLNREINPIFVNLMIAVFAVFAIMALISAIKRTFNYAAILTMLALIAIAIASPAGDIRVVDAYGVLSVPFVPTVFIAAITIILLSVAYGYTKNREDREYYL